MPQAQVAYFELRSLRREVDIGCHPDEHGVKQPVLISIRAALSLDAVFAGDTKEPPYNYSDLIDLVDDALASRPRFILQETLLYAVARRVLANPLVESVELNLAKTARYEGCESIGIQATLTRNDIDRLAQRYPEESPAS